jgi:hypothetical protein
MFKTKLFLVQDDEVMLIVPRNLGLALQVYEDTQVKGVRIANCVPNSAVAARVSVTGHQSRSLILHTQPKHNHVDAGDNVVSSSENISPAT